MDNDFWKGVLATVTGGVILEIIKRIADLITDDKR